MVLFIFRGLKQTTIFVTIPRVVKYLQSARHFSVKAKLLVSAGLDPGLARKERAGRQDAQKTDR